MTGLPDLLASIRKNPADEARRFALSRWLWDNGRQDEAVVIRCFWATLRDTLTTGVSPEEILDDVARSVRILAPVARNIEACGDAGR
jgi:hypothetical protein